MRKANIQVEVVIEENGKIKIVFNSGIVVPISNATDNIPLITELQTELNKREPSE